MKKTYIIPTTKVVKIQTTHLLTGSDVQLPISTTTPNYDGSTPIESREERRSVWDDDDYEDYEDE